MVATGEMTGDCHNEMSDALAQAGNRLNICVYIYIHVYTVYIHMYGVTKH